MAALVVYYILYFVDTVFYPPFPTWHVQTSFQHNVVALWVISYVLDGLIWPVVALEWRYMPRPDRLLLIAALPWELLVWAAAGADTAAVVRLNRVLLAVGAAARAGEIARGPRGRGLSGQRDLTRLGLLLLLATQALACFWHSLACSSIDSIGACATNAWTAVRDIGGGSSVRRLLASLYW